MIRQGGDHLGRHMCYTIVSYSIVYYSILYHTVLYLLLSRETPVSAASELPARAGGSDPRPAGEGRSRGQAAQGRDRRRTRPQTAGTCMRLGRGVILHTHVHGLTGHERL